MRVIRCVSQTSCKDLITVKNRRVLEGGLGTSTLLLSRSSSSETEPTYSPFCLHVLSLPILCHAILLNEILNKKSAIFHNFLMRKRVCLNSEMNTFRNTFMWMIQKRKKNGSEFSRRDCIRKFSYHEIFCTIHVQRRFLNKHLHQSNMYVLSSSFRL